MSSAISKEIRMTLMNAAEPDSRPIEVQRRVWEEAVVNMPLPPTVTRHTQSWGGVACELVYHRQRDPEKVLLFLHGGGYVQGSCITHRPLAAQLSLATEIAVLLVDYRLAPEHPFPAAVEDSVKVFQALLASGKSAANIAIAGDSAGGGLAVSTLLTLRDQAIPLPYAAALLSPWTDLTVSGETIQTRAAVEPLVQAWDLQHCAAQYIGAGNLRDPIASPCFADLQGLPPILIQVGDHEILLSDSLRLAENARTAGVVVEVDVWEEMWHVFPAWAPDLPEGQQAIERIGAFLKRMDETKR
jgi:acetyl esterase/lipase